MFIRSMSQSEAGKKKPHKFFCVFGNQEDSSRALFAFGILACVLACVQQKVREELNRQRGMTTARSVLLTLSQEHTWSSLTVEPFNAAVCFRANCICIQCLLQGIRLISNQETLSHLQHIVVPRLSHANLLKTPRS